MDLVRPPWLTNSFMESKSAFMDSPQKLKVVAHKKIRRLPTMPQSSILGFVVFVGPHKTALSNFTSFVSDDGLTLSAVCEDEGEAQGFLRIGGVPGTKGAVSGEVACTVTSSGATAWTPESR